MSYIEYGEALGNPGASKAYLCPIFTFSWDIDDALRLYKNISFFTKPLPKPIIGQIITKCFISPCYTTTQKSSYQRTRRSKKINARLATMPPEMPVRLAPEHSSGHHFFCSLLKTPLWWSSIIARLMSSLETNIVRGIVRVKNLELFAITLPVGKLITHIKVKIVNLLDYKITWAYFINIEH